MCQRASIITSTETTKPSLGGILATLTHLTFDPILRSRETGVHSRKYVGCTSSAPGYDADLCVTSDEGSARIALAAILPIGLGAQHVLGDLTVVVIRIANDTSATGIAVVVTHDIDLHLYQHIR